jgi:thiamine pyrophosphokinase
VLEETSGRLDQILGNINTLYRVKELYAPDADRITIYMISSSSISWLLESGKHKIYISDEVVKKKLWCALIPIGGKSLVTTAGLKWNLGKKFCLYWFIILFLPRVDCFY